MARGLKVAFLTRGYGRHSHVEPLALAPHLGLRPDVRETGDEAQVLATLVPGACVVVDADRVRGARHAIQALGAQVLILDDGFQRRHSLHRDLDLLVASISDPGAGGALLPLGSLREPLSQAEAADALVLSRAPGELAAALPLALAKLPSFEARIEARALRALGQAEPLPLAWMAGRPVAAFCGLGQPGRFEASLRALQAQLLLLEALGDHAALSAKALQALGLRAQALGAEALICTLKDMAKLPVGVSCCLPVLALESGLVIDPRSFFEALLDRALNPPTPA
jgi:tetraacyldisaccharide 4'-kinase